LVALVGPFGGYLDFLAMPALLMAMAIACF
jgi:hypothetical protein